MTVVLIAVSSLCFLISWLPDVGTAFTEFASFDGFSPRAWNLVTYAFVFGGSFIALLFSMFWLYFMGQGVEARTGRAGFVGLYLGSALASAVFAGLAGVLLHRPVGLAGPFLPLAAVTVVWGALFPEETINLYMIIPIKGKWIAAIDVAWVFFSYGLGAPVLGVMLVLPLAFLWFYGRNQIPWLPFATNPFTARRVKNHENARFNRFVDDVRSKEKEREERERLRKLFESSLDDPDDRR